MSSSHAETTTENSPPTSVQERRSYVLELVGAISVIGFFVGIYFAYQTQISGVVTQREFDQLRQGQSLAEVNKVLGFEGTPLKSNSDKRSSQQPATSTKEIYVWENSTISFVQCTFADGLLTEKKASDLP